MRSGDCQPCALIFHGLKPPGKGGDTDTFFDERGANAMEWAYRGMSLVARSAPFSGLLELMERVDHSRGNLLRVLTYHRVDELDAHPGLDPGLISATPRIFEQQSAYLVAN